MTLNCPLPTDDQQSNHFDTNANKEDIALQSQSQHYVSFLAANNLNNDNPENNTIDKLNQVCPQFQSAVFSHRNLFSHREADFLNHMQSDS